jgi:cbb3-type cytochrome oxidase subunit 1
MQQHQPTMSVQLSPAGIIWLRLAVVYLIAGIALGIAMGATENFTLRPVHAHINLLGWATLAVAGLLYTVFPQAGESKLAKAHFWLLNVSMPIMLAALTIMLLGNPGAIPVLAISEFVAAGGMIAFAINVFVNVRTN